MARARVAALPPDPIDAAAWDALRRDLPRASERTLRIVLRESGRALTPFVEGVRQDSLDELDRTLTALAHEYEAAPRGHQRRLRALVITSKTHADFAARRASAERKPLKEELAMRIRSWLLNPPLYPEWCDLRNRQFSGSSSTVTN
jgi:hypothetical protein